MTEQTIPYPSWSIAVTMTHDSTLCTAYKDEGIGLNGLIQSLERCRSNLKAFDESLTQGEIK